MAHIVVSGVSCARGIPYVGRSYLERLEMKAPGDEERVKMKSVWRRGAPGTCLVKHN